MTDHADDLRASHTPEAIRARLIDGSRPSYLRDMLFGAVDGAVTTFAVVAGVTGASLASGIVVILGVANLVADGFSMAVSNFLGTRAEAQVRKRAWRKEEREIDRFPAGEREEIRQIFASKGFEGDELERIVEVITSDKDLWIDTMLREEFGLSSENRSPRTAAWVTFAAFSVAGAIPLLPYFASPIFGGGTDLTFAWSAIATAIAFFLIGAFKSRFVDQTWVVSGAETLLVGGCAASLAYLAGFLLRGVATLA